MSPLVCLQRAYLPDDSATLGRWVMPDGWVCFTLENPWKGNQRAVSCIPEGRYDMALRESPIVARTTRGRHARGWEIRGVPDRTFIMVHPGNYERDTEGCVLPGLGFSWHPEHGAMVTNSQAAFTQLMERLAAEAQWCVDIRPLTVAYP